MTVTPLAPGDPRTVGRYRLSGRLGGGGMGEVFFGRSPGGRPVAVKVVRPELAADPLFRRRFGQEVEAARRVGGFHTAPVVDADPDADPPWLVTAYVPGPSLMELVAAHGPLPEPALRVLGAGIAEALEAVHGADLVHRDLKPSNILIADDGPRVIDFGIARAADVTALTRAGGAVGTPGYMAPEQVTGEPVGPATDVFAFGAVLCFAAGVRPFGDGPPTALLYRVVHQEPDLSGLPDGIRGLVAECLAKDPERRPDPDGLLAALTGTDLTGDWLPGPARTLVLERAQTVASGQTATRTQTEVRSTPPPAARGTATAPRASGVVVPVRAPLPNPLLIVGAVMLMVAAVGAVINRQGIGLLFMAVAVPLFVRWFIRSSKYDPTVTGCGSTARAWNCAPERAASPTRGPTSTRSPSGASAGSAGKASSSGRTPGCPRSTEPCHGSSRIRRPAGRSSSRPACWTPRARCSPRPSPGTPHSAGGRPPDRAGRPARRRAPERSPASHRHSRSRSRRPRKSDPP
ncbi:serine/threonine-protein kinase [Actinomadura nitritigenes]|uniref:serine/threonine-protein kinase n=1 Tax=Actinomadura nitritigenes TaxID=134602 RepID=UPI0036BF0280